MDDFPEKPTRSRRKTTYKGASNKKTSGLVPKTDKQKELLDALKEYSQVGALVDLRLERHFISAILDVV